MQQDGEQLDYFHNYKSVIPDGRCLKSATTIIRASSGSPVAALMDVIKCTVYNYLKKQS